MTNNKVMGLLGLCAKAGKLACGTDACIELIQKKKAKLVIVAQDAVDRTKRNLEFVCKNNNTSICLYGEIESLSHTIGKKNKAVIAIKDENFAKQILKIIHGGEIIG